MLDASPPFCAEIVIAKAIHLEVDYSFETSLQQCPLRRIDLDLEDRILNPLTEVLARLGDPT